MSRSMPARSRVEVTGCRADDGGAVFDIVIQGWVMVHLRIGPDGPRMDPPMPRHLEQRVRAAVARWVWRHPSRVPEPVRPATLH